ncbi:NAD(P)-binding protein [Rhizodiscina lignyota]|uniref:3-oxoacyl-[acyl-carrier-protein] reductase n=1 Tax=Rhizodiscina lignyota TaxID=1504668 RepID=A0A9P4IAS2_9PEZI|nr:NAD(P)-binding protein [Rhizodiscina lignyota]
MSLAGKSCIVTGAAGGLGLAIANALHGAGASVTICDISETLLSKASEAHPQLHTIQADVTQDSDIQKVFDNAVNKFGKVDVLVNNAGIIDRFEPVGDLKREMWDKVIAINATAPIVASGYAVRQFLSREREEGKSRGVIVNVASAAIAKAVSAGVAYTSSKHALVGATKHTAATYAKKGIRCNAIVPGGMMTNIAAGVSGINEEGQANMYLEMAMQPELCSVDEVAQLVVFLCEDKAKIVNGAVISADNGWTCW